MSLMTLTDFVYVIRVSLIGMNKERAGQCFGSVFAGLDLISMFIPEFLWDP